MTAPLCGKLSRAPGANCGHPVHQRGIFALLRRDAHTGFAERIEHDRHATRGRTGQGEYVGCHRPIASAKALLIL
ncbi:hypothetical protein ACVWVY_003874 [Bradyrhizobium sp. URHC0002]